MKYETTSVFDKDVQRLTGGELTLFKRVIRDRFNPACDRRAKNPAEPWPKALRVKPMKSRPDILEMTWDVDGRGTFQWIVVDGEPRIRWRRVGGHAVLGDP